VPPLRWPRTCASRKYTPPLSTWVLSQMPIAERAGASATRRVRTIISRDKPIPAFPYN